MIFTEEDAWDNSKESLEEKLYWDDELNSEVYLFESWGGFPFEQEDIVMTNEKQGGISTHRMYVVDSYIDTEEGPQYLCYGMSSKVNKANINNKKFPYNILIKNYGSIVNRGSKPEDDVIIKLDQPFTLDSDAFVEKPKKAEVTNAFKQFIKIELNKIKRNISTAKDYWDNGKPVIQKNF